MTGAPMTSASEVRVLIDAGCVDLLRRHRLGRLGVGLEGWPAILPVVTRTAPGDKLGEGSLSGVAFEIDDADRYGH